MTTKIPRTIQLISVALSIAALAITPGSDLAAAPKGKNDKKVEVCHRPPSNPDKWFTILISEKDLASHLAHGDFTGPCATHAETLCNDNNYCTIDEFKFGTEQCKPPAQRRLVDCNDDKACTTDTCDKTANGGTGQCVYTPNPGQMCNDNMSCTEEDTCNAQGACVGIATAGCCTRNEDCAADSNLCTKATCDLATQKCKYTPTTCSGQADACTTEPECNPATGLCEEPPITCAPRRSATIGTPGYCYTLTECNPTYGCQYALDMNCVDECQQACIDASDGPIGTCYTNYSTCIGACGRDNSCETECNSKLNDCLTGQKNILSQCVSKCAQ